MRMLLLVLGFGPPLLWVAFVRRGDRHDREPVPALLLAFAAGAFAVVAAVVVVGTPVQLVVPLPLYAVLGAPLIEEVAKVGGTVLLLGLLHRHVDEPVDPAVYATTVGFGFAAAENVQYFAASAGDPELLAWLFVVRSGGTAVMHGVATGAAGLALGRRRARGRRGGLLPGLVAAVALHAAWNLFAFVPGAAGLALGVAVLLVALLLYVRGFRRLVAVSPHRGTVLPPLPPRRRPPPVDWRDAPPPPGDDRQR